MKKFKTLLAAILVVTMFAALMTGCKKTDNKPADSKGNVSTETKGKEDKQGDKDAKKEIKMFTTFHAVPGTEVPDDNRILKKIAEKIGAWSKISWLTGQTADERIGIMIAGGDYPDMITGSTGTPSLIEAGALIAINEYWDEFPNVKNYLSEEDWNRVRHADGNIYLIPQFGIIKGKEMGTKHWDMGFWIQKKVLIWAGYPQIKTLDQYFDLIESYKAAHPKTADGQETVGFTMSTEDWRYFGVESPPLFLSGYPNDGACAVDPDTATALDYNTFPKAKEYYQKMNEVFNKGLVHPETYTMSYDQYISLLSTGRVLGTLDQFWNYNTAVQALEAQGKFEDTYVPLPLTFDGNTLDRWHSPATLDVSNGLSITKSCKDIKGAMQFINDLLTDEITALIYWGEEGVDYMVDTNGEFYRTEEQRANVRNTDWVTQNMVNNSYNYFPHYAGLFDDGINAIDATQQPREFFDGLEPVEKELLNGYGYKTFLDFLSPSVPNEPWYPMWSYTNTWNTDTDYGAARAKITDLKHEYLPKAMMAPADQFEKIWDQYMEEYRTQVDIDAYLDELTKEIQRRVAIAEGN